MAGHENKIEEYEFKNFSVVAGENDVVEDYSFQDLGQLVPKLAKRDGKKAKFERLSAEKKNFNISPIVKEHRGLLEQEREERERKIRDEVERRIDILREEAFQQGFQEGIEAGKQEVYNQTRAATEEKLNALVDMINDVLVLKEEIINNQKQDLYKLVKNLTKWVILRELKDDGEYITRLLEKLVTEIQTKSNLLVQVDQNSFESMTDVLETVQERIGALKNVRVEVDYDIPGQGIIIESDNGIINGTFEEQMVSLDKLFESVGLKDEREDS
jgi:flagellar assembly protein FliH